MNAIKYLACNKYKINEKNATNEKTYHAINKYLFENEILTKQ